MPSFHAYVSAADQQMIELILEVAPGESLSSLVQRAIRQRFTEIARCEHDMCQCVGCGALLGHPAMITDTTTAAANATRTAARTTGTVSIEGLGHMPG
jgi:hypothetical protein